MDCVDLLIPIYNMPLYYEEAIDSINQSQGLDEEFKVHCILIDDGSLPKVELSEDFLEKNPSVEITHIRIKHGGKSVALNEGLKQAQGDYIAFLDADDKLPSDSLLKRYQVAKGTNADIVLGGFQTFNESGIINYRKPPQTSVAYFAQKLLTNIKSPIHLNSMLIKKSLVEKVGDFDRDLLRGQDKDYAIRLFMATENIQVIDQPVYQYRRYSKGWKRQLGIRLLTMRCKSKIIKKHTKGFRLFYYQVWGWGVELMKLGYELVFGVYKK